MFESWPVGGRICIQNLPNFPAASDDPLTAWSHHHHISPGTNFRHDVATRSSARRDSSCQTAAASWHRPQVGPKPAMRPCWWKAICIAWIAASLAGLAAASGSVETGTPHTVQAPAAARTGPPRPRYRRPLTCRVALQLYGWLTCVVIRACLPWVRGTVPAPPWLSPTESACL